MKKDILSNPKVKMIIFLVSGFLLFLSAEIVRVTKPLFDKVYYGYLTPMILDVLRMIIYFTIFFVSSNYAKKNFDKIESTPFKEISTKRVLVLYVLTFLIIFVVTAILNFRLKVVVDLGENVGAIYLYNNIAKIGAGIVRMLLSFLIIRYVDVIFKDVLKEKIFKYVPVGGIASMLTIGLFELLITPKILFIDVLFMLMHIIYGYIYRLAYCNRGVTILIMIFIRLL